MLIVLALDMPMAHIAEILQKGRVGNRKPEFDQSNIQGVLCTAIHMDVSFFRAS